ncbi:MAG: type II toxin-antitoxin system VapC family toxin [Terracidiphilus sp.]
MSLVLDGSATLGWFYPDETTVALNELFDQVIVRGAFVPALWKIEVANSLSQGIRRHRITLRERNAALADLDSLSITIDRHTSKHVWRETLSLADKYKLTVYDATYLELALRLSLPLATLDEDLRAAARQEGVQLLGK